MGVLYPEKEANKIFLNKSFPFFVYFFYFLPFGNIYFVSFLFLINKKFKKKTTTNKLY